MKINNIPLPICVAVLFNIFLAMFVGRYVFPFLPAFVKWCGATEQGAGLQVGLIAGALTGGMFPVCFMWGYLIDTFSMKKCAIVSGSCLLLATLSFGFSLNVTTAALIRLLSGIVMGQYIIFQALMSHVCDEDNLAFGTSITLTARLGGSILGPVLGGILAFPGDKYPSVFALSGIFGTYPCLLASVMAAVLCAIGLGISIFFLPTHHYSQEEEKETDEESDTGEEVGLLCKEAVNSKQKILSENSKYKSSSCSTDEEDQSIFAKFKDSKFYQVLSNKESVTNICFAGLFSFIALGFDEVFATLATTAREYHGVGLSDINLGLMMLVEGVFMAIIQLGLIPKLDKYLGSQSLLFASSIVLAVFLPLTPAAGFIKTPWVMWMCVTVVYTLNKLAMWSGLLATFCLVTNSVHKENLGTAMALVNVFIALGSSISTIAMGGLYSWSLTNVKGIVENKHALGFPFDSFFVFILLALFAIVMTVTSYVAYRSRKRKT